MYSSAATRCSIRAVLLAVAGTITLGIVPALTGCAPRSPAPPPATSGNPTAAEPVAQPKPSTSPDAIQAAHFPHQAIEHALTDDDLLAQSLSHLKQGNLVYNTPQKMKSSQTAHITARIGSDQVSVTDLQSSLPSTAGTTTATVATPISTKMKMTLKSADFDITPLSSDEQIVSGTTPTTWEWDVVPKYAGTLRLHLAATVELNNLSRDFAAIDREVTVQVDPVSAVQDFLSKNLIWVLGGCGTALAALWGWWKKRKVKPVPT